MIRVVLLPGLDGTTVLAEPLLAALSIPAVAIGYPQEEPTGYAELLPFVLERLPVDEEFVVLGWSFGGPLALQAAATRPEGLRGLILGASFVQKPVWFPSVVRFVTRAAVLRLLGRRFLMWSVLGEFRTPEFEKRIDETYALAPKRVVAARARETLVVDVREELQACPVPILYLGATQDRVVPPRNLHRIRELRPDVQVAMIDGPHVALMTNPEPAARAIEAFCADLSSESLPATPGR